MFFIPGIRINLLRCGNIELSREAVFGGRRSFSSVLRQAAAPSSERLLLPCFCYLIEHPRGLILVDTGVGRVFSPNGAYDASAARSLLGVPFSSYLRPSVREGQSVGERLAALGLRPENLDILLLTHLDADHVGGLHELSGAKRILVPEDEYYWSCRTVYKLRQPQRLWLDMPMERFWYRGSPLGTNRWAYDLFGDESVMCVNLPGHTDGLCALMIRNGKRFAVLASDAAICRENVETLTPPGFCFDAELDRKALHYLRTLRDDANCAGVLLSHDREETRGSLLI